jgi:hypothetical protein
MERESLNIEEIMRMRRHAVEESLRTISVAELNALTDEVFRYADHPFLPEFVSVVNDSSSGVFHHAHAGNRIQVLYCQGKDVGMWFLPGVGTGRLEPRELKIMREVVRTRC